MLLVSATAMSQKIDTIVDKQNYKSYISLKLRQPLFVAYKLYKGGGDCDRRPFSFNNDTKLDIIGAKEYSRSGYDKGHLANAEDFAYDCVSDEKTFRYYNCLPQTPNLNRGIWKMWETEIRKESQTDSLYIITGGVWTSKTEKNGMQIPGHCWKVVFSLSTKKLLHCLYFTNSIAAIVEETSLKDLETKLGYKLPLAF